MGRENVYLLAIVFECAFVIQCAQWAQWWLWCRSYREREKKHPHTQRQCNELMITLWPRHKKRRNIQTLELGLCWGGPMKFD